MSLLSRFLNGGGIHVPYHKDTANSPTEILPIPKEIVMPMSQHAGAPCEPCVKKGDQVYVGTKIGEPTSAVSAQIFSSVSGTVKEVKQIIYKSGAPETVVIITSDGLQTPDPSIAPPVVTDLESFLSALKMSGIVGLGGAGFPTDIKVRPKNLSDIHTLLINGAECEPYLTTDNREFIECTDSIIFGIKSCQKYLDIEKAIICIEDNKPEAIKIVKEKIKDDENISVCVLESKYPQGAQNILIHNATGLTVPRGARHTSVGVLMLNVTTVSSIGKFLQTGMPLVSKRITVSGDAIINPKNVEVPIGTQLREVIDYCGKTDDMKKIVVGGPMMGTAQADGEYPVTRQNNGILAFREKSTLLREETECIRCGRCVRSCPIGLSPVLIRDAYRKYDAEKLDTLMADMCIGCGTCSYVCPAKRALTQTVTLAKGFLKKTKRGEKK